MIVGEFWSDRLVGLGIERSDGTTGGDCDGRAHSADDLAGLIASLGVPGDEARAVAATFWAETIVPVWAEWQEREAERDARSRRGIWRRLSGLLPARRG
jgi:hypothetical protein